MRPDQLDDSALAFLTERHLASMSTVRPDGSIHVVPVGFSYDPAGQRVRIITRAGSWKARHLRRHPGSRVTVSQVDGGRWLSLEGDAEVSDDPVRVAAAVEGYAARYRQPEPRDDRVAIEIRVDRVLGRA
jgi:PPOX class probable F420-dependent enzyme